MHLYTQLSADKKFAVKTIFILVVLFVVISILTNYLNRGGDGVSMGRVNYVENSVSTDMYIGDKTEQMFIDPIMPPVETPIPGSDAESYEVRNYFVLIETSNGERDCNTLLDLKQRDDVIFESVSESIYGCNVTFKVTPEAVDSVLAYLDTLDPREVNENTYTIKREVSQYENQIAILEGKRAALDTALEDALKNFAEVEATARRTGDVSSLAQITESKLNTIERINASRLEVVTELDRLNRAMTETLDQMNYVNFSVNVYENEWVRGSELKDSWVVAIQQLIRDLNGFLQDLSIGFVQFALMVIKYTLYASVLYIIARPIVYRVRQSWKDMR